MNRRLFFIVLAAAAASFVLAGAQASAGLGTAAPSWEPLSTAFATFDFTTLLPADDPAMSDFQATSTDPKKLPKGSKYKLFGTAKDDVDPENSFNEVISFDTTDPNAVAGATRRLGDHIKIDQLDNQVELKYYFVGRTCGAGSPRIQLAIDGNGDGKFNQFTGGPDQNAFGYLGDAAFGGGCLPNQWVFEDMTDSAPKWDLSQFGGGMTNSWDSMETFLNTTFPNHRVRSATLVDDSASFFVAGQGCAYFDLVSTGPRTLTGNEDTSDGGKETNNC
jgi:hypothetical protein